MRFTDAPGDRGGPCAQSQNVSHIHLQEPGSSWPITACARAQGRQDLQWAGTEALLPLVKTCVV